MVIQYVSPLSEEIKSSDLGGDTQWMLVKFQSNEYSKFMDGLEQYGGSSVVALVIDEINGTRVIEGVTITAT